MNLPRPIPPLFPVADPVALLRDGELELVGRLLDASNATFTCRVTQHCPDPEPDVVAAAIYKPIRGERPLDDFPVGTLANREVAAYVVSEAMGWAIVPPTVLRDGPLGPGALQLWVDADPAIDPLDLIRRGDVALRRIALFDAAVNNADRKVGHLIPVRGDHVFGVDHGICFAAEAKLRTVLWGWHGEALDDDERAVLEGLGEQLDRELGARLRPLLAAGEIRATIRRVDALLAAGRFPDPPPRRRAIPWPPF